MKVDIILSTYNGARFLREQIESLQKQSYQNWTLTARDDGSTDDTLALLRSFADLDSRIKILELDQKRLGPTQSFANLMSHCLTSDYLFFCDQDDVWHPEKLALSLAAFKKTEERVTTATPIAVHSDLIICDEALQTIDASMKRGSRATRQSTELFMPLLGQNFVTGCTLGINRSLLRASLPIPTEALMHDWWIALVASATGELVYLPQALVFYRQHGKNASGSALQKGLLKGITKFVTQFHELDELMHNRFRQSLALENHLQKKGSSPALSSLNKLHSSLNEGRVQGTWTAISTGLHLESFARSAAYYFLLLKNGKSLVSDAR